MAALERAETEEETSVERRANEDDFGVCLDAVKNFGHGEWNFVYVEERFGVLKFDMSLRSEGGLYGDGDFCRPSLSIDVEFPVTENHCRAGE